MMTQRAIPLPRFVFLLLMIGLLLSSPGCAMQRAIDAEDAQKQMIGMSREQIFACMGIPKRKASEGTTEIWEYRSSDGYTEKSKDTLTPSASRKISSGSLTDALGASLAMGNDVTRKRHCLIKIVMREARVAAVHYSGPSGGFMTEDEQCAFATRNCLKGE